MPIVVNHNQTLNGRTGHLNLYDITISNLTAGKGLNETSER